MSLAVALAVAAFFLELGLDLNVASYPYFVLSFLAILIATIVGGPLGGVVAAVASWALNTIVLAVRVPAEEIRPILDGINSGVAFVVGLFILEARRRPIRPPTDELAPHPESRVRPTDDRRARILASAVDDLAASRSTAQIADVLARRLLELTGAGWVAVFVRPRPDLPPALRATAGAAPTGLPDRLETSADPATIDGARNGADPVTGDGLIDPDPGRPRGGRRGPARAESAERGAARGVGGARRVATARPADDEEAAPTLVLDTATGATAVALARLAGSAIERDRLIASGQAATDAASTPPAASRASAALPPSSVARLPSMPWGGCSVEHAVSELGAEFGLAYAVDRRERSYRLVHARGYADRPRPARVKLAADVDGPVTRAARTGRPVEIGSPEAWRREFPASPTCPR